jgi:dipeptidyl aminopeptidase/acylaminoacyl peptidase
MIATTAGHTREHARMTPPSKTTLWALGLCMALLAGSAAAQPTVLPKAIPAEAFFRDADFREAVLSPSGKQLAVTLARSGARVGLYVIDLAKGLKSTGVGQFNDVDVQDVHWVNEDRLIFSATDYAKGSGSGEGAPGLFAVNADGSKFRELVQRNRNFVVDAKARNVGLEWNHILLKVPEPKPGEANEEVLLGETTWKDRYEVSKVTPLWLNVRNGTSRTTDYKEPYGALGWIFDSKGEPRVVITEEGNRSAAYWRGPAQRAWTLITEGDLIGLPFVPKAVDDAGQLFVLQNQGEPGLAVISRYDFERKAPSPKALVSTPGFDFRGGLILRDGKLAGVRVDADAETTVWFDADMKQLQALVDERFPGRVNQLSCSLCGQPGQVALVRTYSDRDPGQLWVYRDKPAAGEAQWQAVARLMPGIDPRLMATVDTYRFKARDGREVPVWVTSPMGVEPGKPAPAVVMVHGGPSSRIGHWAWDPTNQFLASRGYLVIEPEFRGSKGYGEAHWKAGWKQWGQAMQDDVADALLWAQKEGLATDRACIAGASYGGYSTLMGLARQPSLYRCGVAWVAVTDLELLVNGSWWVSDDIGDDYRKYGMALLVGEPAKDAAMLAANSPVLLADKIKAPVLLAFGEEDIRVPLAHGKRMRAVLIKAGNEPEWVTYAGEGHGWALLKNKVDFAQRMERFLAKHLQTPAP